MKNPNPNNPKIIEGTTAKVRMEKRTAAANFEFSLAYSVKYKAVMVPNGTAAIDITITKIKVPIKAGKIPPSVIPLVGKEAINSQENLDLPSYTMIPKIINKIAMIKRTANWVIPTIAFPFKSPFWLPLLKKGCCNSFVEVSILYFP